MKPSSLWTLGLCLVLLGVGAHWFGWDALLWFPRAVLDWLSWGPAAILDAIEEAPSTVGLIALGIVLMVVAKMWMRQKGGDGSR